MSAETLTVAWTAILVAVILAGASPAAGGPGAGTVEAICPSWPCVIEGVTLYPETDPAPSCADKEPINVTRGYKSTMAEALIALVRRAREIGRDTIQITDRHHTMMKTGGRVRTSVAAGTAYRCKPGRG